MMGKFGFAIAGALLLSTNAIAQEQLLSTSIYKFTTHFERDLSVDEFIESKNNTAISTRSSARFRTFPDPSVPRNRMTLGYAYNYSHYTPVVGPFSVGYLAAYNTEPSRDTDAYYGQLGASFASSSAWIFDYKITDRTSVALVRTYHYHSHNGFLTGDETQTGIYIGTNF